MRQSFRKRPSPAMIVALVALFVALSGSSYAALKIGARDIKRGAVGSRAIADKSVRSKDIRDGNVAGRDVKNESLTNSDIDNRNLQAKSAETAASAARAGNADTLDGFDGTAFTRGACSSRSGAIHGYARINGNGGFSSTFTTVGVELPYNCSGQTVEARRQSAGFYEVRFNGTDPGLAVGSTFQIPSASPSPVNASLSRTNDGTYFAALDTLAGAPTDAPFVILLL